MKMTPSSAAAHQNLQQMPSSSSLPRCTKRQYSRPALRIIRAQSFSDQGRSSFSRYDKNHATVDANLSVLRERIGQVRMKERYRSGQYGGWTYAPGYNYKLKREADASQLLQLATIVAGTIGFTCLAGTLFLCFISLLVHSNPTF